MKELAKNLKLKTYKLLRWSEKYTKTDMVYLTRSSSWLFFGHMISALSSFAFAIVAANMLPKELYGSYKFVLSFAAILAIPTLPGINVAVSRSVARGLEGELDKGIRTRLKWGVITSLSSLFISTYYFVQGNIELALALLLVALFAPLMESLTLYQSLLNGKKMFDQSTKYQASSTILSYIILIFAIAISNNLIFILLSYFGAWTATRTGVYFLAKKKFQVNKKLDTGSIRYGKHLTVMKAVSIIANHLDKILIFHFLGATEAAIYSIAVAIPTQIHSVFKNLQIISRPKFVVRNSEEISENLNTRILYLLFVILLTIAVYVLFAPFVFDIFFPKYTDAIRYSQYYSIFLLGSITFVYTSILEAKKGVRKLYKYNIFGYGFQIALLLALIPTIGIMGAILSHVIGQISFAIMGHILTKNKVSKI